MYRFFVALAALYLCPALASAPEGLPEKIWLVQEHQLARINIDSETVEATYPLSAKAIAASGSAMDSRFLVLTKKSAQLYSTDGILLAEFPLHFSVNHASSGTAFVTESKALIWSGREVYRFDENLGLYRIFETDSDIRSIRVSPNSEPFVLTATSLTQVSLEGNILWSASLKDASNPRDIAFSGSEIVVLTTSGPLHVDEANPISDNNEDRTWASAIEWEYEDGVGLLLSQRSIAKFDHTFHVTDSYLRDELKSTAYVGATRISGWGFVFYTKEQIRFHGDVNGLSDYEIDAPSLLGTGSLVGVIAGTPDKTPPELKFTIPSFSWITVSRPVIPVEYSDDQSGVNPSSLYVALLSPDAEQLECGASDKQASCVPKNPLPEGHVTLSGQVSDNAGNVSGIDYLALRVDYTPPDLPNPARIRAVDLGDGRIQLTVAPGTVEPRAQIQIQNLRTGELYTVQSDYGGGFEIVVHGEITDHFAITLTDEAGNTSDALDYQVPDDIPEIVVFDPVAGDVVRNRFQVTGRLLGNYPAEVGIVIGGAVGKIDEDGFFAVDGVRTSLGQISFTVRANSLDGVVATKTVPIYVEQGPETLDAFHVSYIQSRSYEVSYKVSIKFPDERRPIRYAWANRFTGEYSDFREFDGFYNHNVWPYDFRDFVHVYAYRQREDLYRLNILGYKFEYNDSTVYEYKKAFVYLSDKKLEKIGQQVWDYFSSALAYEDSGKALGAFVFDRREDLAQTFSDLSNISHEQLNGAGSVSFGRKGWSANGAPWAEILVPVNTPTDSFAIIMLMQRDVDGVWRIAEL